MATVTAERKSARKHSLNRLFWLLTVVSKCDAGAVGDAGDVVELGLQGVHIGRDLHVAGARGVPGLVDHELHLDLGHEGFVLWHRAMVAKVGQVFFEMWRPAEPISRFEAMRYRGSYNERSQNSSPFFHGPFCPVRLPWQARRVYEWRESSRDLWRGQLKAKSNIMATASWDAIVAKCLSIANKWTLSRNQNQKHLNGAGSRFATNQFTKVRVPKRRSMLLSPPSTTFWMMMRLAWPLREFRFLTDLVATLMIFNHVKGYICRRDKEDQAVPEKPVSNDRSRTV
jgi:hypothetical protein